MSAGGGSLHKKDYAALAGLAALTGTGLGAAGIGPLAGLFGSGNAAAAAGLTAEPVSTMFGMGALDVAAPGEAIGAFTGSAVPEVTGGLLGKGAKGLEAYQKAMNLVKLAQGPEEQAPQAAQRPQQTTVSNDPLATIEAIYGIKKRKKEYLA